MSRSSIGLFAFVVLVLRGTRRIRSAIEVTAVDWCYRQAVISQRCRSPPNNSSSGRSNQRQDITKTLLGSFPCYLRPTPGIFPGKGSAKTHSWRTLHNW
ncbi:hypothetical protein B0T16DRAFT_127950 [Cercophora newfieldiana]|uniref:Secreted protein n=1 Tax=Cercophora newfieldiana TaxID=92897 RepID=A0AA40CS07_9PEZI|nr:hypothetical protein B0T16DRAFT_127950 [Cercophora newfieldiana]